MITKKLTLLLLGFIGLCSGLAAQNLELRGSVFDADNAPLAGASVVVKGSTTGVFADIDGAFKISLKDPNSILVVNLMGYETKEVAVNGRTQVNIRLQPSTTMLEEVVMVGYGSAVRRDLTGSISSVKAADMAKVPVADAAVALGGRIAGVQVTQSQGSPDAELSIKIRGGNSITQSNEPLYIIDGFPSDDGLKGIDPSDIGTIDVLKDASATAIYGARGAHGVVVITTKSGRDAKVSVTFDTYFGIKQINKYLDVLNPREFVDLEYERAALGINSRFNVNSYEQYYGPYSAMDSLYNNRPGINWQKEVFDQGTTTQFYKVGISGGNKTTRYNLSGSWNKDGGILQGSGLDRYSLRSRLSHKANDRLKFNTNVSYTQDKVTGIGSLNESGQFSRMVHIIQYRPTYGIKGDDSQLLTMQVDDLLEEGSGNQLQNPIMSIEGEQRTKQNKYLTLNADVEFNILPNLTYRGMAGLRNKAYRQDEFYTSQTRQARNAKAPYGSISQAETNGWTYNNTLTLNLKPYLPTSHSGDIMLGQEDYYQKVTTLLTSARNFPDENQGTESMQLGRTPGIPQTYVTEEQRLISFFARANYSYKSRYIFAATLRADGSSKFGKNNKWGVFPSVSGAWRASDEQFIKDLNVFSNLKLRASIGTSGNNRIGNNLSRATMEPSFQPENNQPIASYVPSALSNPNLRWETTVQRNLGIDFGFLEQRIQLVTDLYLNSTHDLLLESNIPGSSGYTTVMENVGKTQNMGVEFTLTTLNVRRSGFEWTTNLNLSVNRNKVVALNDPQGYFTKRSGWTGTADFNYDDYIIREGDPLGQMYGYKLAGIYTAQDFESYDAASKKYALKSGIPYDATTVATLAPGSWKFEDVNGDGKITTDDMTVIGNAAPKLYGGLTNTFTYSSPVGNFDLTLFFNFSYGNQVYNANKMYYTKMNTGNRNSLGFVNDRYTYVDESGVRVTSLEDLQRLNEGRGFASVVGTSNLLFHSGYVESGSFFRINNITLGYTLPERWMKKVYVSSLRVYGSVYNLHNFNSYSGYDPEVNVKPNGGLTPGVDWGAYPRSLSVVFGANLAF